MTPAVSYQINPLTRIGLQYSFSILRSDSPLAEDSDTHEVGLSVQREFTPRTSGTVRYTFSRFQAKDSPARDAHLPKVGLIHALSPTIRISADAGPLLIERPDGRQKSPWEGASGTSRNSGEGAFPLPTTGAPGWRE